MTVIKASVRVHICGGGDSWKMAEGSDPTRHVMERRVLLEMQGDAHNGYHLVATPDGCLTADTWYATQREALETARELCGVDQDEWTDTQAPGP